MRMSCFKIAVLFAAVLLLAACKKAGTSYDVYFYTDIESPTGLLTLKLDDKVIGELPLIKTRIRTDNDTILNNALHLQLKTGNYKILARDKQGNAMCSGTMKIHFNRFGGATNPGAIEYAMTSHERILVARIYFESGDVQ